LYSPFSACPALFQEKKSSQLTSQRGFSENDDDDDSSETDSDEDDDDEEHGAPLEG
jgi:intraflagellar transport protein 46